MHVCAWHILVFTREQEWLILGGFSPEMFGVVCFLRLQEVTQMSTSCMFWGTWLPRSSKVKTTVPEGLPQQNKIFCTGLIFSFKICLIQHAVASQVPVGSPESGDDGGMPFCLCSPLPGSQNQFSFKTIQISRVYLQRFAFHGFQRRQHKTKPALLYFNLSFPRHTSKV